MNKIIHFPLVYRESPPVNSTSSRTRPSNWPEHLLAEIATLESVGIARLVEDQEAALATWEWLMREGRQLSPETTTRYVEQTRSFLRSLSGPVGSTVTLWHLLKPQVGAFLVYSWRQGVNDLMAGAGEAPAAFGDTYRAARRFVLEFICAQGRAVVVDYDAVPKVQRGHTARDRPSISVPSLGRVSSGVGRLYHFATAQLATADFDPVFGRMKCPKECW